MYRPARPILALSAVVFGLALGAALAESGLRLLPAVATPRLPLSYDTGAIREAASERSTLSFDPTLGWVNTPGARRTWGGVRYRNNRDGLRADREYSATPTPGVRRFAAYGDSFTYCQEVELANCWTEELGKLLPESETLNLGVPSYAIDQAWLRYERDGNTWHPCAVLIGHMVENVNRMVNRFRPFYNAATGLPLAKPRYLVEDGRPVLLPNPAQRPQQLEDAAWVEANLGPHDAWYFPGTFVANPLDRLELARLARTAAYRFDRRDGEEWTRAGAERAYRPGAESLEVAAAVLAGFAERVRADGATAIVLVFPMGGDIVAQRDSMPKAHAPLLEELQRRGIPTVDLTDALGEDARHSELPTLGARHYRPHENGVVARTLAKRLPTLAADTCGA
jgi:hypothetical protein